MSNAGVNFMYRGIGNVFRELSQLQLMRRLRDQYDIRSVLNAPFDHATDPKVDNQLFEKWEAWSSLNQSTSNTENFDLVWNFDFVQRIPSLLKAMSAFATKFVLAFVPNGYNGGALIHAFYHRVHQDVCYHPEAGDAALMNRQGLESLFRFAGLRVLESGWIDSPPWLDYTQPLAKFFTTPEPGRPESIYDKSPHLPMPKSLLAFERLARPFHFTSAHHCFCLGETYESSSVGHERSLASSHSLVH